MTRAIVVHEHGGPEVLRWEEHDPGRPGAGQVLVRHTAVGLNFIDIYFRTGLYPAPAGLPLVPGSEAAGVVEEVGPGVTGIAPGQRVAYVGRIGAYAERRVIAADQLVVLPEGVPDETAAAAMLKGMTAEYLLRRTFPAGEGHTVLFHAAAGGVGLIFGQWAKHLGVTAIGTAGSPEKVELARQHGYAHVIDYSREDFVARVREITSGRMCDAVYDAIGKDTFPASLDALKPRGFFISFGQSSGPIAPFNMAILAQKGSLFATRPSLFNYIATRGELEDSARALFDVIGRGAVTLNIGQRLPLAEAARAHADLEARRTVGATVLVP